MLLNQVLEIYAQNTGLLFPISVFAILGGILNIWRIVGIRENWIDRGIFILLSVVAALALLVTFYHS